MGWSCRPRPPKCTGNAVSFYGAPFVPKPMERGTTIRFTKSHRRFTIALSICYIYREGFSPERLILQVQDSEEHLSTA